MKISARWVVVGAYTIGIFAATPFLPDLIRLASSRWSSNGVSRFVLSVEVSIALLFLILAGGLLINGKKRSFLFLASIAGISLLSFILYQFLPNPYEFTHLPEYAVLSLLIVWAFNKTKWKTPGLVKEKKLKYAVIKSSYFMSIFITGIVGTVDEIYQHFLPRRFFTVYDIFLNILGAILGVLIFWGIKR
jgi:VanZ family protein